jgi:hypothetical protein
MNSVSMDIGPGGIGVFIQSGGACSAQSRLYLGQYTGQGTYVLSNGSVSSEKIYIGGSGGTGDGNWVQTGGTASCQYVYVLGHGHGSAMYLGGGSMTAIQMRVTGTAGAVVRHTGGLLNLTGTGYYDGIWVSSSSGQFGEYRLSGTGRITARNLFVGEEGAGSFDQTGGNVVLSDKLSVGYWWDSKGTYCLRGGTLSDAVAYVGYQGDGNFLQQDGTHVVTGTLYVGYERYNAQYAVGVYTLSRGRLSEANLVIGYKGIGAFVQTGGSCTVGLGVNLGIQAGGSWPDGTGTFSISGGTCRASAFNVGVAGRGDLQVLGPDANLEIVSSLSFGSKGGLTALPGSAIHLVGPSSRVQCQTVDANRMAGLQNLRVVFEGGTTWSYWERAGRNLGADPNGFQKNFCLDTLQLGGALVGKVRLLDAVDNELDGANNDVLYVGDLLIASGSVLDLYGSTVYVQDRLVLDGNTYYASFPSRVFLPGVYPELIDSTGGGRVVLTPEPAALGLLVLGGLGIFRRRGGGRRATI